jgi:flagellar hook-associated protein 2
MADMRIGGLASGMDIDSLVSDLMKAERMPLDKLEQKKQYMEWQRDDYREINKMLLDLDTTIFEDLVLSDTYSQKTVSVSDSSAVSIKNVSSTTDFSGSIEVKSLAEAATMFSSADIRSDLTDPTSFDSSKSLSEQLGVSAGQTITIKAIKDDGTLQTTDEAFEYTIKSTDSLNDIISKINAESGVSMFYDSHTGRISVTAKNSGDNTTGTMNEIELSALNADKTTGGNFFTKLSLEANNVAAAATDTTIIDPITGNPTTVKAGTVGSNAVITYNGLITQRTSNTFNINGFDITLKNVTEPDKAVTFSSTADVDAITEKIVKFVDEYNKLIEKVNGELNEKRYRDYQPLTAEQKKAMEEKDIELWEEKARSGTLRNDSVLSSAINKMRSDFYSPVSGLAGFNQLAQIGITTTNKYLDGGKLTIDEDKLKEEIAKDPNAIYQLFAKDGDKTEEKGIAERLRDTLKATMESIEKKAGKSTSTNNAFSIGKNLNSMEDQIARFQDRLIQVEDRYWRQFTAMEKAIQQANQQSAYLMQQFGGM